MMPSFRPLPILTLFSVLAFVVLLLLGNWQWARFQEKTAALQAPLTESSVAVAGPPRGPVQFLYGALEGRAGWRILAPYPLGADRVLFADVGFAPGLKPPERAELRPVDPAQGGRLTGILVKPKDRSPFAAAPDPTRGIWYDLDLRAMARAAGYAQSDPHILAARYAGQPGRPNPFAHATDPLPPERHVGYAITWWGLAAGLVVIYALLHVRRGRLSFTRG